MALLLLSNMKEIVREFEVSRRPCFFFDLDGTLIPFADDPTHVAVPAPTLSALRTLLVRGAGVAVISGRSMEDLSRLLPIGGLTLAADFGLRIWGPTLDYCHQDAEWSGADMEESMELLSHRLAAHPCSFVERKEHSFAVHYRRCRDDVRRQVLREVNEVISGFRGLRTLRGRLCVEVFPAIDWSKARAARLIEKSMSADLCLYCGDDYSDETAIRQLTGYLTVRVTKHPEHTRAGYYVTTPGAVIRFVEAISMKLPARSGSSSVQ